MRTIPQRDRKAQDARRPRRPAPAPAASETAPPTPESAPPGRPSWRHPSLWVFAFALLLYLPALRFDFVSDDHSLIKGDVLFNAPRFSASWLARDFWAGTGAGAGMWRPLITWTYWVDSRIGHGTPGWFHAMNLVGHGAASAMIAALVASVGGPWLAALLAGLLFASLPLHLEAVVPISGRTDVYATAFLLAALWRDRVARARGRARAPWSALLLFALALVSKENAIVLLPVLAIAEWVDRPLFEWRRAAGWMMPYVFVGAAYLVVHAGLVGFPGGVAPATAEDAFHNRLAQIAAFGIYMRALLPGAAHVPYGALRVPASALDPAVWGSALLFVVLAVASVIPLRRRDPVATPLALGWFALLFMVLPSVVKGYMFFGERFIYMPAAGLVWAAGLALGRALRGAPAEGAARRDWKVPALAAFTAALVLVQTVETARGERMWASDETIAQAKVRIQPWSSDSHSFQASKLFALGRADEAAREANEALRLDARNALAHDVLAAWYLNAGRPDSALAHAQTALDINRSLYEVRYVAGKALIELGRPAEALPYLERLGARGMTDPMYAAAWGTALMANHRPLDAAPYLEHAAADQVVGRDPRVHYQLGLAHAQAKDFAAARADFERAVSLDPGYYDAWLRVALSSAMLGDRATANAALTRAAALPEAKDGRVEALRHTLSTMGQAAPR